MADTWTPRAHKSYKWIVKDPELLGGKLAIRGTRISVALVLECLAAQMTLEEINDEYQTSFTNEVISEIHTIAAQLLNDPDVAA